MTDRHIGAWRGGMSVLCFVAALAACQADSEALEGILNVCSVLKTVSCCSENVNCSLSSGGDVYVDDCH